jgi:hypothetical protein
MVVVAATLALSALVTTTVFAAIPYPITITTCKGYTVSKRGDGAVFVRCPGAPLDQPMFSIGAGCCMNPAVVKREELSVTIDCK